MFVAIYERNSKLTQKTKINWSQGLNPEEGKEHKNTQKFGEEQHGDCQRLELGEQSQLHTYLKRQANLTITLTQDLALKEVLASASVMTVTIVTAGALSFGYLYLHLPNSGFGFMILCLSYPLKPITKAIISL